MPRRTTVARVDANQPAVVAALRGIGASVLHLHTLPNCFDILVGFRKRDFIMEIKDGSLPESKRQLTEGEAKFRDEWRGGTYHIVTTPDEAIAIVTAPESK
ncbi:hypothetical protein [Hymenobacter negativus]|uniref:VRR-NUC domain-containing protein n=1 Tax=Hymenobacter negativus TaxID=2795026 RepID=A0ABS3QD78_9BACT|nr:hypothetical protein [Hymenobacter negativus]MBO2009199.1 hypothetical protein [Hymenobacter negativus]